jgi:hypothetical protein
MFASGSKKRALKATAMRSAIASKRAASDGLPRAAAMCASVRASWYRSPFAVSSDPSGGGKLIAAFASEPGAAQSPYDGPV